MILLWMEIILYDTSVFIRVTKRRLFFASLTNVFLFCTPRSKTIMLLFFSLLLKIATGIVLSSHRASLFLNISTWQGKEPFNPMVYFICFLLVLLPTFIPQST